MGWVRTLLVGGLTVAGAVASAMRDRKKVVSGEPTPLPMKGLKDYTIRIRAEGMTRYRAHMLQCLRVLLIERGVRVVTDTEKAQIEIHVGGWIEAKDEKCTQTWLCYKVVTDLQAIIGSNFVRFELVDLAGAIPNITLVIQTLVKKAVVEIEGRESIWKSAQIYTQEGWAETQKNWKK